ncbi:MAG: hypothetical protein ACRD51_00330, partial [Candidatus Acidiferrum sp.]
LLFDWRLSKAIEHKYTPKYEPRWIPIPDLPLRVMLEAPPPTLALLQKDPLLLQSISDDCQTAFTESLRKIVPRLQGLDAECGAAGGDFFKYAEGRKRVMLQIDQDIQQAKANALNAIQRRWTQLEQQKKEYKSYRQGVAIKLVKGGVGAGAAIAGLAGAVATGGATLALSIIGTYRAVVDGGKTLWECIQEADRVQKRVVSGLEALKKTYAKDPRLGAAREVAASTVNAVLKLPINITNVKTLEDDSELWRGKLTHLVFLAHELAEKLNQLLEDSTKLGLQLATDPDSKKKQAALKGFEADINKLLTEGFFIASMGRRVQIQKSHQDAEKGLKVQEQVAKGIEELKAGRSKGVDWFDQIIAFAADAALTGAGYGVSPPDFSGAASAVSKVQSGAGIAMDGASTLYGIFDIAAEHSEKVKEIQEKTKAELSKVVFGAPKTAPAPPALSKKA